jgi:hypothetical protein
MVQTAKIFRLWVIFFDIENIQIVQMVRFELAIHTIKHSLETATILLNIASLFIQNSKETNDIQLN